MKKLLLNLSLLIAFSTLFTKAQEVPVGLGSYNLSQLPGEPPSPGQWDGAWFDAPARSPRVTSDFNQIPTTHEWWTAFMWDPGLYTFPQFATWVYPYGIKSKNEYGFEIFKNRLDNVVNTFPQSYNDNDWPNQAINVGLSNQVVWDTLNVVSYGDFHCKIRLENSTASKLEATLVNGVPYCFIEKTGPEAVEVWMPWDPIIDNTIGTNVIGVTVQGSSYGIFFPAGSTYNYVIEPNRTINGAVVSPIRKFVSTLNGKNYLSVAPLPDNSLATLQAFANHAFVFITDTKMNWSFNEANAKLATTFDYTTQVKEGTETNPMIGLLPHHWKNSNAVLNGYDFHVPRGQLKCVNAKSFTMELDNFGLLPTLPLTGKFPDLYKYIDDQMQVVKYVTSGDNYVGGKQIAKLAKLTEIADFVGHATAKAKFLAELKVELQLWLKNPNGGNDGRYLYYNNQWHTLTPYYGILGPQLLNDFHFSMGYLLRGAATIAKLDPTWALESNWGGMVNLLIRSVDNWDRTDPMFPYMRFHSPFLGHSHAGGTSARAGGAGEESSSEAINFGAAVFQWGLNSHNTTMRDLGAYLYLTEVETTKEYWYDVEDTNFPASFDSKYVWTIDGASHAKYTWFGVRPEHGLGINVSLMDCHLLYLAHDTTYAKDLYSDLIKDMRDYYADNTITEEQAWQDVILAWRATFDAGAVLNKFNSFGPFPYRFDYNGGAVSAVVWDIPAMDTDNDPPTSHFYHWVHALDSLGHVNSSVLADYASYGVFDKNECRHYVMYNPPGSPSRTVNFTDGRSWFLPEDTTITYKWCPPPLPVTLVRFDVEKIGDQALLNWTTALEINNSHFIIQRSVDGINFEDIGKVYSKANAPAAYSFIDSKPNKCINYYRLKQVDYDGKFEFSPIKTLVFGGTLLIFPNPAYDVVHIATHNSTKGNSQYTYSLTSVTGQELLSGRFTEEATLNISSYASGVYILSVKEVKGSLFVIEKIIKN